MGSECYPSKRYNISMSKRTRRPLMNLQDSHNDYPSPELPLKGILYEAEEKEEIGDGKSLKQLMTNGSHEISKVNTGEEIIPLENKGRNSLGEHFTKEENQLQLVKTHQKNGVQGMVNRYVKVLSHLIKARRNRIGSRKKPVLQLTM